MTQTLPPFDHFNHNIFEAFTENVLDGVYEIASAKEINLTDAEASELADKIADCAELPDPLRFMRDDPLARSNVCRLICECLDFYVSQKFTDLYETTFGASRLSHARSHLRRAIMHHIRQGTDIDFAKWPALDCNVFAPYFDRRADNLFTQWNDGMTISFNRGFVLDRVSSEGPALIATYPDAVEQFEFWRNGKLHRDPGEGPALIRRDTKTGWTIREEYRLDGEFHRDGGPAGIEYCEATGQMLFARYFHLGQVHRDGGPACCNYDSSGRLIGEFWYSRGELHREGAPAVVERDADGAIILEAYWHRGERAAVTVDRHGVYDGW